MAGTLGVATAAAKPVSLIQRLKRGTSATLVTSKAAPTSTLTEIDRARPSSAQDICNPTSSDITSYRGPSPRSRDSSRMRGGAGPSITPGRGSTALKTLTSSAIKVRSLDEECSACEKPSNISNRGKRDVAEDRDVVHINRGFTTALGPTRPASTLSDRSKFANRRASGGLVWEISRSGSNKSIADSKTYLQEEKHIVERILRRQNVRASQRSSNDSGYDRNSSPSELRQLGHHERKFQKEPARGLREWKGEFVRGNQRLEELQSCQDATEVATQAFMTTDGSHRIVENRPASAPIRVIKGAQRGVDQNCEPFRRQTSLLKEKVKDTKMREEEVIKAERLQRQSVDEIDLDEGGISRDNHSQDHVKDSVEEFTEAYRVDRLTSSRHIIDQPCSLERTSLESLNKTMIRLTNGDYLGPLTSPLGTAAHLTLVEQNTNSSAGNASNSNSSTSFGFSLPSSQCSQKLVDFRLKRSAGYSVNPYHSEVSEHNFIADNRDCGLLPMAVSNVDSSEHRETSPLGHHSPSISGTGAVVAVNHLQDGGNSHDQQALHSPAAESRGRALSRSIYESVHHNANDENIAHLQRVFGELKGSMEGVKIRIEVEGEGWRGRVDRLEKELESVREIENELIAEKHSFKNALKTKLSEFRVDTEKLLQQEREQVQMMVEERIERQLKLLPLGSGWAEVKDEMQLLWSEMDSLIKSRQDLANHVEHLTVVANKEQDMLKSENGSLRNQLQSLQDDGAEVIMETVKEELGQTVEKIKNDDMDMELEIQGLKNIEKVLKVELGDLRTRLGKVQDEKKGMAREKEMALLGGSRERLLIMERIESLSQLYLGGLEEVRQDMCDVKHSCNERVDKVESQWNSLKRHREVACEDCDSSLPRQVLLDELDQFRCEIAEMMDIERGFLKEMLERESTSIWRKVMDAYADNKSEMLNMLKLEIQKQLHSAREKVLLMTDALKHDMDVLKKELNQTQDRGEDLTRTLRAAKGQKRVVALAPPDAPYSATKEREILIDTLASTEGDFAIATWKQAINGDITKERAILEGVDNENLSQSAGLSIPSDPERYILKMEEKLSSLMTTVEQLHGSTNSHHVEKKRLKHQENERIEKDWTANMEQLNQVVRNVEERVNETFSKHTDLRNRLKWFEGNQTDSIHSIGEERSSTCSLEKTINLFLPRNDAAARCENDTSFKMENLEERIEGFSWDNEFPQLVSLAAEAKVESMEILAVSTAGSQDLERDLKGLEDRVEDIACNHCQSIAEVETRIAVVECTLSDIQHGWQSQKAELGMLAGSVDVLQRKMRHLEQIGALSGDREPATSVLIGGLENRIEHLASATFNNLQLLDNKVEHVLIGVQSALEGALLAENKCGALGAELVKVFRMLTAAKASNNAGVGDNKRLELPVNHSRAQPRGRSHSPRSSSATQRLKSRSQSPPPRLSKRPTWNTGRGPISTQSKAGTRVKRSVVRESCNLEEGENQGFNLQKVGTSRIKEPYLKALQDSSSRHKYP